jgi:hypothetical protein
VWLAALLAASAAGAQERPAFDAPLPPALPDVSGWESDAASIDLEDPAHTLEYELRVEPGRQGLWTITRYRTRYARPPAAGGAGDERLQWNDAGKLRRFACRPAGDAARGEPGGSAACEWRELSQGSPEYQSELASVLLVWRMHRRLLHARARSLLAHDD